MKQKILKYAIAVISLTAYAISVPAQAGSNIVSGLLHTQEKVTIYVDGLISAENGSPGYYERIYTGTFVDSYTFKTASYRVITVQYCTADRCKLFVIVEGGQSENFHEIDVHFNRDFTDLAFKVNARNGQFKNQAIRAKY